MEQKVLDKFVESWGMMGSVWGINISVARVHALLIASDEPISLEHIAEKLHISITNPSEESRLPYFKGKAIMERTLKESGLSYAIVRPTVLFGKNKDILINNIAWLLRRLPVYGVFGSGTYRIQQDVADVARPVAVHVLVAGSPTTQLHLGGIMHPNSRGTIRFKINRL